MSTADGKMSTTERLVKSKSAFQDFPGFLPSLNTPPFCIAVNTRRNILKIMFLS